MSYKVVCRIKPISSNGQPSETGKEDNAQSVDNSTIVIVLISITAVFLIVVVVNW